MAKGRTANCDSPTEGRTRERERGERMEVYSISILSPTRAILSQYRPTSLSRLIDLVVYIYTTHNDFSVGKREREGKGEGKDCALVSFYSSSFTLAFLSLSRSIFPFRSPSPSLSLSRARAPSEYLFRRTKPKDIGRDNSTGLNKAILPAIPDPRMKLLPHEMGKPNRRRRKIAR